MMNQTNISAKTILAKLLATENLRVEHDPKASTASFDLKNRVLTCPVWEAMDGDMYDMLLSHEVSHAKNTPWEGWHTSIKKQTKKQNAYKHFLNVVEDARIEKLIKRQYPGLRRPFLNAYKALHERDLFQVKGKSTATMYFIDRVNLHCKMGFAMNIKFNAIERGLLNLVENAETWDDVVNATEKIWEYSKKEQQEDQENQKKKLQDMSESLSGEDTGEEEESEDYENDDDSFGDYDEDEDGEGSEDSDEDADSEESEDGNGTDSEDSDESNEEEDNEEESGGLTKTDGDKSEEKEEKEEKSKPSQTGDGVDESGDDEFIPQAKTDEAFRENERQLNAKNAPAVRYINLPTPNLSQIVVGQKIVNVKLASVFNNAARSRSLLKEFQEKNQTYINSLAKEFEMKKAAKKYVKAKVAESGDINVSKLGLYRTEDDIFKRVTTLHQGKNHGLILLLDKSGSMRNNMSGAIEQILILASFCRKVNIPFVAYGFTNPRAYNAYAEYQKAPCFSHNANDLVLGKLKLREMINSNMKAKEFTDALMNQLSLAKAYTEYGSVALDSLPDEHLQNTPLNEALVTLIPMIKQFKTARKLDLVNLVVVHDGDADYSTNFYTANGATDRFDVESERVYFREPISGIEVLGDKKSGYRGTTVAIMDIIKKVCDVGIYGFFIGTTTSDIRNYYRAEDGTDMMHCNYDERAEKAIYTKQLYVRMNKEKFLESFTLGYSRFYMLPVGNALKVQDQQIVINGSVTARKLATAFIKQGKAKYSNRVLVSRFIDRIAK